MKDFLKISSLFITFILAFSCGKESIFTVNCADCDPVEPDSAYILVKLSFSELNDSIPLVFYRGKIEKNVVEWIDTATISKYPDGTFELLSPINKYYSIKAKYRRKDGTSITVVDGDKMVKRHEPDACDTDCWLVKGGILDVRLKYE